MRKRKPSNMVSRGMRGGILLSVIIVAATFYVLYTYGYFRPQASWPTGIRAGLTLFSLLVVIGAAYGFFQGYRPKRKIDELRDALLQWEKGSQVGMVPRLGEDEIGRLGEQLERIGKRWEEQVSSLQRLSTHNAQLAEQARVSAIVEERQRLARELHDAVSQQLFAISMTATAVSRTLEKDFDKAQRQVELIEEMASVAQSEMRALLLHLRPVYLEGKELSQGLRDLVRELKTKVPMDLTLEMDEDLNLGKGIENHLFRIIQEAMSNTLRHAKADKMEIRIHRRGEAVKVTLRDNGVGFQMDGKKQASYGLSTMQERVHEVGGSIQFITAPGKGTRIEITIPLIHEESGGTDSDGAGQ
ncbi:MULTISPECIES: sensor histidine kinase [Paenibacillus]|uniref:Sensor histidine kinase n=1 Tax=Paenibacillus macerans TaxID=44252 RepID=A0A090ZJP8_PAEMA|nr:sensor histidine kinase [Paenibacillus macerans]KFN10593.1 histidine kinase family protein [Paenibacillus macerans]MCY7561976.1 sensor histidine kinase [Paenibacillus macerans]MDU5945713.1 sensor histidine kinase [Paenibacillus macerans]MEC0332554.1 sensor histidine kinase [Paenibacillus macerans]MUG26444.1 sensor histidine kinase [Paenibacillus macerans]